MGDAPLIYSLRCGVASLTLNRPQVMNALNSALRKALIEAIARAESEARVIVITGSGRAFCSGQDLVDTGDLLAVDFEAVLRHEYEPLLRAIYDCPLPVIMAVNGPAAGAGANLALAGDVVIASESASFIQSFTRIGLIPDAGGTYWLPRQIGFARAMGAMLLAEPISARQATEWGMIWQAVPESSFADTWRDIAEKLARGPQQALKSVKQALRASADNTVDQQLALEARLQGVCGKNPDFREGVAAFLEKRAARFQGN